MSFRPDYYEILQINHQADLEVVRAAYRSLGKKNHPVRGGDEETMKLINEAHEVLSKPSFGLVIVGVVSLCITAQKIGRPPLKAV